MKPIKDITLETPPNSYNDIKLVKLILNYKTDWVVLHIEDLLKILELWIIGEEELYPPQLGFKGRWLLYEKIAEVFKNTPTPLFPVELNNNNSQI